MFYIYIIKSIKSGKIYIGYSSDLKRRMIEHNSGQSDYTKSDKPWKLVYYEAYASDKDARVREKRLKNYAQSLTLLKKRIFNSFYEN